MIPLLIPGLNDWVDLIVGVAAIVGIAFGGWRALRKFLRRWDALNNLVDHELNHNSGTSVKDKAYQAARDAAAAKEKAEDAALDARAAREAIERLEKGFLEMSQQTQQFMISSIREHQEIWAYVRDERVS